MTTLITLFEKSWKVDESIICKGIAMAEVIALQRKQDPLLTETVLCLDQLIENCGTINIETMTRAVDYLVQNFLSTSAPIIAADLPFSLASDFNVLWIISQWLDNSVILDHLWWQIIKLGTAESIHFFYENRFHFANCSTSLLDIRYCLWQKDGERIAGMSNEEFDEIIRHVIQIDKTKQFLYIPLQKLSINQRMLSLCCSSNIFLMGSKDLIMMKEPPRETGVYGITGCIGPTGCMGSMGIRYPNQNLYPTRFSSGNTSAIFTLLLFRKGDDESKMDYSDTSIIYYLTAMYTSLVDKFWHRYGMDIISVDIAKKEMYFVDQVPKDGLFLKTWESFLSPQGGFYYEPPF